MRKYTFLLPHNWLEAKGLARIFWGLFYADFIFTLYTAYHCVAIWLTPLERLALHSAPLRRIWTLAFLQALFLAVLLAAAARGLQTLSRLTETKN